jgi:hypothetical protein
MMPCGSGKVLQCLQGIYCHHAQGRNDENGWGVDPSQCSATGIPPQDFKCAMYFYNKLYIHIL